jgi:hypothetical protein
MPEDFQNYDWFISEFADSPTTVTINAKKMRDFIKSIFNRRNVEVTVSRALAQSDAKSLLYYQGVTPINLNLPGTLLAGFNSALWNLGTANITFVPTGGGVTAVGELVVAPGQFAYLEQQNGNRWKIINLDALIAEITSARGGLANLNARFAELEQFNRDITNARFIPYFDKSFYASLQTVIVGGGANLIIEVPVTFTPDGAIQTLFDGDITGSTRINIAKGNTDRFSFPTANLVSATMDGATINVSDLVPTDGKIHYLRFEYSSANTYRIAHVGRGQASASSNRWQGYMGEIKVTNGATITTFAMDQVTTTSEPSLEANNTLNYVGIVAEDWLEKTITDSNTIIDPQLPITPEIAPVYAYAPSTTQVFIFQKLESNNWLRYDFRRDQTVGNNVDVWRLYQARKGQLPGVTPEDGFTLANPQDISLQNSQWEYAIKPLGRPDFNGGLHGDEKLKGGGTAFRWLLDGKPGTLGATPVGYQTLEIVQETEFFDPNDGTTKIADVYVRHVWDRDGLKVDPIFEWTAALTIELAYVGMLPLRSLGPVATLGTYLNRFGETLIDDTVANFDMPFVKALGARLYNSTNNFAAIVKTNEGWFNGYAAGNVGFFIKHTQNSNNKPYAVKATTGATVAVVNGTRWGYADSQYTFQEAA